MSITQGFVLAILSVLVTFAVVRLIPRARHSDAFDRVLWGATWLLSFVSGWYAIGSNAGLPANVETVMWQDVPVLAAFIGVLAGAVVLNGLLWLMDRFAPPDIEPEPGEEVMPDANGQDSIQVKSEQ